MNMTFVDCVPGGGLLEALGLGWLAKEHIITGQIEQMLKVEYDLPSEADRELFTAEFEKFSGWANEQGLRALPASGHVAAAYLVDLVLGGASLNKVADAAAAIKFAHKITRQYLDWAPIHAALDFAMEHDDHN